MQSYLKIISEAAEGRYIKSNFEEELRAAIEAQEVVSFNYMKKDGSYTKMTVLPVKLTGDSLICYVDGVQEPKNFRKLYISAMGEQFDTDNEAEAKLKEYAEKKIKTIMICKSTGQLYYDIIPWKVVTQKGHRCLKTGGGDLLPLDEWEIAAPMTPSNGSAKRINDNFVAALQEAKQNREAVIVRVDKYNYYVKDIDFIPLKVEVSKWNKNGISVKGFAKGAQGYYNELVTFQTYSDYNHATPEMLVGEDEMPLAENSSAYYKMFAAKLAEYKEGLTDEEKEACEDLGTANGWNEEEAKENARLRKIHNRLAAEDPVMHKFSSSDSMRGWHECRCSCGFSESYDSSD